MDERARALRDWAAGIAGLDLGAGLERVTGDASTRRYFRLRCGARSWICVDSPPATEKNREFLQARAILAEAGIQVPELHAVSETQGFFLLQDLGDELLLPRLTRDTVAACYGEALDTLYRIQRIVLAEDELPPYSAAILREELRRFPHWFCTALLGVEIDADAEDLLCALEEALVDSACEQPLVFVHRDFHSRNLMPQPDGSLGVIDFQDAVRGPVCYDLVSLLRDCYVRWPRHRVQDWALAYRQRLLDSGICPPVSEDQFMRWFDLIGLQRHLKVLGNFARLAVRDKRPQYLRDLPLVLTYVGEVLDHYSQFADFRDWFSAELTPLIRQQEWSGSA